ncbi:SMI1/KNR4 family protein [Pseudomonas sp. 5P_3.1_Bac2]|uniref:SMI1/KNR4 family protein n=1 Tax=Pseudomonas sp. 5P_3.1_Bac2 TaxID=2971617 RepID=UPI0021C66D51|nr:SMI1/KNR4 family protein [Pseudomonas sp. 5P_3.1_Bac2]MCU1719276.1 SMI1/KNR4 family protein [Pseudomonas sp. 5P_3.1_Bac2]
MSSLDKLLSSASSSLSERKPEISGQSHRLAGALADQLLGMLFQRNGFYALESALHVFPTHSSQQEIGLCDWNENILWRSAYKGLADGCLFFAEDVFGGQFCIKDNNVCIFDPETGALEYLADDIESWVKILLSDYEALTGYPLAHQWQKKNGQLPTGKRLLPKVPFVLGGEFVLENLYLADAVEGMRFRADIASQIKDLPDGAQVKFNIEN